LLIRTFASRIEIFSYEKQTKDPTPTPVARIAYSYDGTAERT
jgi:hypothetical protein